MSKLNVVFCWHMHQPHYQDLIGGEYFLPWTYLHGTKDYVDMAAHLEAVPGARAVVNFAPILLEQIADYHAQINGFFSDGRALRDPLLAALAGPVFPKSTDAMLNLIKASLRVNRERLVNRFPAYRKLAEMADVFIAQPHALEYLNEQFPVDLLMWYHLAWLGETVRRSDVRVKALIDKGAGYTVHERRELLRIIGELLASIVPRYRALAQRGQVELSCSPYAHPIVPLLLDLKSAHEAMPDAPLPAHERYPGGEQRALWHMRHGIEVFERHFGFKPQGCWPSEGSLSAPALKLIGKCGMRWVASGQNVFHNSKMKSAQAQANHYQPYRVRGCGNVAAFFRDDGLSDLIGFTYSNWHGDDAVANLLHHLDNIAQTLPEPHKHTVAIILDGENAWEYYPENAYYFLSALYKRCAEHPHLEMTTFSRCLDAGVSVGELAQFVAGSWVYGTFSTWIGSTDKNRGWDMLVEAKHAYDRVIASGRITAEALERVQRQLALCEGSDWFWWFGDYNPETTVSDFERLFRLHLTNLYQMLGVEPPEYLAHTFTRGSGAPASGGVMRPGSTT